MDSNSNSSSFSAFLRVPPRTPRSSSSSAFTLIEVIIVIVMLAILAGIVLPRMAGGDRRLTDAQAGRVGSLLSIVGWRGAVAPEPMELEYDPVSNSLRLLVNRAAPGETDPQSVAVKGWRPDPIVAPLVLDRLSVQEAWWGTHRAERSASRVGSGSSGAGAWRLPIPIDRPRETIVLVLADRSGARSNDRTTYRVELVAGRTSARVTTGATPPPSLEPQRELDLDALGLGGQRW